MHRGNRMLKSENQVHALNNYYIQLALRNATDFLGRFSSVSFAVVLLQTAVAFTVFSSKSGF